MFSLPQAVFKPVFEVAPSYPVALPHLRGRRATDASFSSLPSDAPHGTTVCACLDPSLLSLVRPSSPWFVPPSAWSVPPSPLLCLPHRLCRPTGTFLSTMSLPTIRACGTAPLRLTAGCPRRTPPTWASSRTALKTESRPSRAAPSRPPLPACASTTRASAPRPWRSTVALLGRPGGGSTARTSCCPRGSCRRSLPRSRPLKRCGWPVWRRPSPTRFLSMGPSCARQTRTGPPRGLKMCVALLRVWRCLLGRKTRRGGGGREEREEGAETEGGEETEAR